MTMIRAIDKISEIAQEFGDIAKFAAAQRRALETIRRIYGPIGVIIDALALPLPPAVEAAMKEGA